MHAHDNTSYLIHEWEEIRKLDVRNLKSTDMNHWNQNNIFT